MKETGNRFEPLRFGTSGLRDRVENMTDMECYINSRGFMAYLRNMGEFRPDGVVALGGDRRESTPRIKRAVAAAIRDMGGRVDDQGLVSTPALVYYALKRHIPSIMVTGSHIPEDRNGIKFTKKSGEILKSDEVGILECVSEERAGVYGAPLPDSLFDKPSGMFTEEAAEKAQALLKPLRDMGFSVDEYIERYACVFKSKAFPSRPRIFFYGHSAVGRDFIKDVFQILGADVMAPEGDIEIEYRGKGKKKVKEVIALRSEAFVAVDTESVSDRTLAIFEKVMNDFDIDIGMTVDGDSDRPLLVYRVYRESQPTGEIDYITGDILGLLTVLALEEMGVEINAVAVPISANDAIEQVLGRKGVEITQTKIGSPYVIAAMIDTLRRHPNSVYPKWNVFSWESNGGFLTGNDLEIGGKILKALPTRDPLLPLISVMMMGEIKGISISELVGELPERYTYADRMKNFPTERSRAILQSITPSETPGVRQVDYVSDEKVRVITLDGGSREFGRGSEFHDIRNNLRFSFSEEEGFSDISGLNYIDGVRIFFKNGDISHLRPSGNAPEFRNYAIADSPKRAREIVERGLNRIIPEMTRRLLK